MKCWGSNLELESTQQYDPYEDETQNEQKFLQLAEELEPMPEVGNNYMGAEMLLPRRGRDDKWPCSGTES